ncbi:GNAT family N-acetyltransferase [Priestia megaterium]|uniref:GNAT family N-acetyltransferase n=1 Tax=Priestia megaterium TaxID=1404 RepID=UPI0005C49276|nr:GNAT family N-acetyltransferase [Priestia megaterium]
MNTYNLFKIDDKFIRKNIDQFMYVLEDFKKIQWNKENFLLEKEGKWDYSLGIEKNLRLIGYIIASINSVHNSVHIHLFIVAKEYRSKNYGTILLDKFTQLIQQSHQKSITLKVHQENHKAIKFYKSKNFFISGYSKEHFWMTRNL